MRFPQYAIRQYLKRLDAIDGWLQRFTAVVISELSLHQNNLGIAGSLVEIGVYRGKSFFVLWLTSKETEKSIAVDPFGLQDNNLYGSGNANKAAFLANARKLGHIDGLEIIEDDSKNVSADRLLQLGGPARIFSVDGSHTFEATLNDLRLAETVISEKGIAVVDDCFNESWPEVAWALSQYFAGPHRLVPFAIVPGKVLLSSPDSAPAYREFLCRSFPQRVEGTARVYGYSCSIIGTIPWTFRRALGQTPIGHLLKKLRHAITS